jgi:hypothetical protein
MHWPVALSHASPAAQSVSAMQPPPTMSPPSPPPSPPPPESLAPASAGDELLVLLLHAGKASAARTATSFMFTWGFLLRVREKGGG